MGINDLTVDTYDVEDCSGYYPAICYETPDEINDFDCIKKGSIELIDSVGNSFLFLSFYERSTSISFDIWAYPVTFPVRMLNDDMVCHYAEKINPVLKDIIEKLLCSSSNKTLNIKYFHTDINRRFEKNYFSIEENEG